MIPDRFEELGVIPVVTIQSAAEAQPLGEALSAGGLPCVEVALRSEESLEGLRQLTGVKDMLVGAGTVLTIEQAQQAVDAGAAFLVSPGLNPGVVSWAIDNDIPIFPGVSSATEIGAALNLGLIYLKFFPAEPLGGLPLIQALSKPFHMMRFIPTGGINMDNLRRYLVDPCILACGGSWMVKREWIRVRDFKRIETETEKVVQAIRLIRSGDEAKNRR